ncbi:MAG: LemA family protein [Candidatus Poribacteria bacterium]
MEDIKQKLSQKRYTDKEVSAILERASKLQREADAEKQGISSADLKAGAEEVGISQEFIDKAIQQLKSEQEENIRRKKKMLIWIGIPAVTFAFIVIIMAVSVYNVLNGQISKVEEKRAQLENVLQRRYDLIPNLIAVAKASAIHNEKIITSISSTIKEINESKSFDDKKKLEDELSLSVRQLMTIMQTDPTTSSNSMFIRLSDEMAGAENRIAVERKRYNEAVSNYNRLAKSFPSNIFRVFFGFPKSISYFQASEDAKQSPKY